MTKVKALAGTQGNVFVLLDPGRQGLARADSYPERLPDARHHGGEGNKTFIDGQAQPSKSVAAPCKGAAA
jgi:hypothetical protein